MSAAHEPVAAKPRRAPEPDRSSLSRRFIGQPLSRVDGVVKVTGDAKFAAEVFLEHLTYAALCYSTVARGRIATIDTRQAAKAPGVLFVMTHENAPRMSAPTAFPRGGAMSTLPVMQDASVHWNGQPVAIVVAESQEQADYAVTRVRVVYEVEPADVAFEANRGKAKPPESVLGEPAKVALGDAEANLAKAPYSVDQTYRTPRHNHCAIELHALTTFWEGDSLTVHDTTQMVHPTRATLADVFGLPVEKVRVLSPFVGGGFGNKMVWNHHILAAAAAREVGRPVRMVLSREGVFRVTGGRTTTRQRVALGARRDGTLLSLIHTGIAAVTRHNNCPEQFTFPARHLYAADSYLLSQEIVELDMVANTFMRAPGESVGTFALECALDELAVKLKMDPIELRRRIEPQRDPTSQLPFSQRDLVAAYRRGAERFGWSTRNPAPRSQRDGDWLVGQGVATAIYPYYRMPGGAASVGVSAVGRATVRMGSHEMGMGTATVQAQVAAELLGLPVERVTFEYGDSAMPTGTVAGGSSQSASIAAAVTAAIQKLFAELLKLAGEESPLAGLKSDEILARDGGLCHGKQPTRFETFASILKRAGREELTCEAPAPEPVEMQQYSMFSYGAQFCELRVNSITGEVRVSRWLGSFDTGCILNPKTAASQFRGGIVMGLGLALTEETLFDERTGRIMNPSLAEYHVPVHLDVPEINVIWNDIPDPHSPIGLRGIGEIGITGVGAAVANAVYNATGIRVRDLPITLDKLLKQVAAYPTR